MFIPLSLEKFKYFNSYFVDKKIAFHVGVTKKDKKYYAVVVNNIQLISCEITLEDSEQLLIPTYPDALFIPFEAVKKAKSLFIEIVDKETVKVNNQTWKCFIEQLPDYLGVLERSDQSHEKLSKITLSFNPYILFNLAECLQVKKDGRITMDIFINTENNKPDTSVDISNPGSFEKEQTRSILCTFSSSK